MSGASLVTLEDLAAAAERVRGTAVRTPVIARPWPAATAAHPFRIKCENLQPMGAFKVRGAFNMLAQLPADARARGVITYSSGNHGQGVAMAAQAITPAAGPDSAVFTGSSQAVWRDITPPLLCTISNSPSKPWSRRSPSRRSR